MSPDKLYEENETLLRAAQNGDLDARSKVYEVNIGLV